MATLELAALLTVLVLLRVFFIWLAEGRKQ